MTFFTRAFVVTSLLLLPSAPLLGQSPTDPSGHWEGTIQVPNGDLKFEVDLAKNAAGAMAGTFGQPAQSVKGLPLASVAVEGSNVTFELKVTSGGGTFRGALLPSGASMSGTFITAEGGYSLPFTLARTGDARIAPAPKSPPIAKELEGTWNGSLDVNGKPMRLVVRMANQPDGSSAGTIVSEDGSGVAIPIALAQKPSGVDIDVPSVGGVFSGVLNDAKTELTGTWTQGPSSLPLTLKRAETPAKK